jgi:hypothetical protein
MSSVIDLVALFPNLRDWLPQRDDNPHNHSYAVDPFGVEFEMADRPCFERSILVCRKDAHLQTEANS